MRRVLVCGGRDYHEIERFNRIMDAAHAKEPFSVVIHGAYRGADMLARGWALSRQVEQLAFPADWKKYGESAGPLRNQRMIREGKPDIVVAFPGGAGTADCIRQAEDNDIKVVKVGGW